MSHGDQELATSGPVATSLLAGTYNITLVSFDGYTGRENSTGQIAEKWFVTLLANNTEVKNTSTTSDLEDGVESTAKTEQVDNNFVIPDNIDSIIAFHAVFPNSNPNSVQPVCAVFDKVVLNTKPVITLSSPTTSITVGDSFDPYQDLQLQTTQRTEISHQAL